MSRIPPPSSSSRSPTKAKPAPVRTDGAPGTRTTSTLSPASAGTPSRTRTTSTLSSTAAPSRARTTSTPASPLRAPTKLTSSTSRSPTKATSAAGTAAARKPGGPTQDASAGVSSKPASLSLREQIALKRAEAQKAAAAARAPLEELGPDSLPVTPVVEEEDLLGRPPLRETIERAKGSGMFVHFLSLPVSWSRQWRLRVPFLASHLRPCTSMPLSHLVRSYAKCIPIQEL
jgi:hypothetical protein